MFARRNQPMLTPPGPASGCPRTAVAGISLCLGAVKAQVDPGRPGLWLAPAAVSHRCATAGARRSATSREEAAHADGVTEDENLQFEPDELAADQDRPHKHRATDLAAPRVVAARRRRLTQPWTMTTTSSTSLSMTAVSNESETLRDHVRQVLGGEVEYDR